MMYMAVRIHREEYQRQHFFTSGTGSHKLMSLALPLSHPVQGGSVWVMVEFRVRLEAIRSRTDWTIQRWYGLC